MKSLLLKNIRPWGCDVQDLLIQNGFFQPLEPGEVPPPESEILDGENQLLVPGFVDGHMHIDKTLRSNGNAGSTEGFRRHSDCGVSPVRITDPARDT